MGPKILKTRLIPCS